MPAAKVELRRQGTTLKDVAEAKKLPDNTENVRQEAAGRTKAKEELLKQGTALEDVTRPQELPDKRTKAKEEQLKQGTALEDVIRAQECRAPYSAAMSL